MMTDLEALVERIVGKHYECEDCWYSCPKSEEGCCDERYTSEDDCNCGVDERRAALAPLVERVEQVETDDYLDRKLEQAEREAWHEHEAWQFSQAKLKQAEADLAAVLADVRIVVSRWQGDGPPEIDRLRAHLADTTAGPDGRETTEQPSSRGLTVAGSGDPVGPGGGE